MLYLIELYILVMQNMPPTPSAYFKLVNVFTIIDRGDVLAGNILDGNINIGDRIELNIHGKVVKAGYTFGRSN